MSRSRITGENLRATLWFWPCVAAASTLGATLLLLLVRPPEGSFWAGLLWPGDRDLAVALLQTVATSVMTATTLTFSLTVLALQLASQQFSPRLLREFVRDPMTQIVLALLVSTFVMALTALRGLVPDLPLPALVLALVVVLGVASMIGLLTFLGHLVKALRVDTMMVSVHKETSATIDQTYAAIDEQPAVASEWNPQGEVVSSTQSGFVRVIRAERIVARAAEASATVIVVVRPGDHVGTSAPLAVVTMGDGGPVPDRLMRTVRDAVEFGFERTVEQDAAFGFRQLTDIAVKAISPGVNDPTTAAHALAFCSDLLVRIEGKQLGPEEHRDERGDVRVTTWDRDFGYYLDLVCDPVRRYGGSEPIVLIAILRLLRDCAISARTDEQRADLRRQVELVLKSEDSGMIRSDRALVADAARRVDDALRGRVREAYDDRAGETRSV